MKKEKKYLAGCLVFLILMITIIATIVILDRKIKKIEKIPKKELTVNQIYPEPWREPRGDEIGMIGKALVKNNISGCGEYYVRSCSQSRYEYLIACNYDWIEKGRWEYYVVWALTGEVMSLRDIEIKDKMSLKAPY